MLTVGKVELKVTVSIVHDISLRRPVVKSLTRGGKAPLPQQELFFSQLGTQNITTFFVEFRRNLTNFELLLVFVSTVRMD